MIAIPTYVPSELQEYLTEGKEYQAKDKGTVFTINLDNGEPNLFYKENGMTGVVWEIRDNV